MVDIPNLEVYPGKDAWPESSQLEVGGGQEPLAGVGQVARGRVDLAAPNRLNQ